MEPKANFPGDNATNPAPGVVSQARGAGSTVAWVCVVFFLSGFPALIYQLIWQRALFAIYGINLESVTVVVTAFMLGLGIGSVVGGAISKRRNVPLLALFGVVEFGIGLFGLVSLKLIASVGNVTLAWPPFAVAIITFLLVLVPTLLMGATLPILTTFLVRRSGNVGRSVGLLYFVNTLGSAAACFAVSLYIARAFGQQGSVNFAAVFNIGVGVMAFAAHFALARNQREPSSLSVHPPQGTPTAQQSTLFAAASGASRVRAAGALVLAGMCGFIALSCEILWFRVYSFATWGAAHTFALLLGAFLLGIALGSLAVRPFCRSGTAGPAQVRAVALFIGAANLLGFLLVPAMAEMATWNVAGTSGSGPHTATGYAPIALSLLLVVVEAGLLGAAFPLICHYAIKPDERAGAGLSYLYLANIVGSAMGSLVTGFVLLDIWGIRGVSVFLALLGLGVTGVLLLSARRTRREGAIFAVSLGVCAAGAVLLATPLFEDVYPKLLHREKYDLVYGGDEFADRRVREISETKTGVVAVTNDGTVYGGGAYDGAYNVDLVHDRNGILRPYTLSLVHPAPREVLMIGLASGSWAQVVANNPFVEKLTVVEIGTAYIGLLPRHDEVKSLAGNPKVSIVIDDGRRWLNRNPDRRFDAIICNTTYNWRAHATNLLSMEFMELVGSRLKPGGVYLYNTTGSPEAMRTGIESFPHALRVINNLWVSDSPLDIDAERWLTVLADYIIDGRPVFDFRDPEHNAVLDDLAAEARSLDTLFGGRTAHFQLRESLAREYSGAGLITDDNMGTEWIIPWSGK